MVIFRGLRFKPDIEIGLFGIFEIASKNKKASKGIQNPLKAYEWIHSRYLQSGISADLSDISKVFRWSIFRGFGLIYRKTIFFDWWFLHLLI